MEEPVQLATVSVAEQTHGSLNTQSSAYQAVAQETTSGGRSDADNRRTQARYACRLGAEVYRTGSSVPNYCCLTDLSSGGCYLEVPLPFPLGSSVEIVVRTYQMKFRFRGAVPVSHLAYCTR